MSDDPVPTSAVPTPASAPVDAKPRRRRWPRVLAACIGVLLVVAAAGYAWLGSEAALRYALGRAVEQSEGRLVIEGAQGSLLSLVRVDRIAWQGDDVDVEARAMALSWSPFDLLSRRISVAGLGAKEVSITLREGTQSTTGLPDNLALPLEVAIRNVGVQTLTLKTPKGSGKVEGITFGYAGGASTHTLSKLRFVTADGTLTGNLAMDARAPFTLRGELDFEGAGRWQGALVKVAVAGPLERMALEASGTLRDAKVAARIVATPFAATPIAAADIDASAVNVALWDPAWPATQLSVKLAAHPAGNGFAGSVDAQNAEPGTLDTGRIPVQSLAAQFAWADGVLELRDATVGIAGGGSASGHVTLPMDGSASNWALQLRDINLAAIEAKLLVTRLSGTLDAEVTGARQRVTGDLREDGRELNFAAVVEGQRVRVERFRARAGAGELMGQGSVTLDGARAFSVTAQARDFDPSRFATVPPGVLRGTLSATGTLAPTWNVVANVMLEAGSRYADTPLSGTARGRVTPSRAADLDVKMQLASAKVVLAGAFGDAGDRLAFTLDLPKAAELRPLLARYIAQWPEGVVGALKVTGTLSGTPRNPGLVLDAQARDLQWGTALRAATLSLAGSVAPGSEASAAFDTRALRITAKGTGVKLAQEDLRQAQVTITGTLAQHEGAISVAGDGFATAAAFTGGLEERRLTDAKSDLAWSGTVTRFTNTGTVPLALEAPATLRVSRAQFALGPSRFAIAEGHASIERLTVDDGRIDTRGAFTGIPLTAAARLAGTTLPFASTLVIGGDWNLSATPKLNGGFTLKRESGDLYASESAKLDGADLALGIADLDLNGRFVDDALDARARLRSLRAGTAEATLAIAAGPVAGRLSTQAALKATLHANLSTLRPLQPWLGTQAVLDGKAQADIEVSGTLADMTLRGTLTGDDLRVAMPQYGVQLKDGRLRAHLADRTIVLDELSLASGEGRFIAEGTLARAQDATAAPGGAKVEVRWRAEKFTVVNRPDLRLVTEGNGTLALKDRRLALTGKLDIVEGAVVYAPTVDGQLSPDVVIVGRPRPPPDAGGMGDVPLALDLDVGFGSNFSFSGDGLETRLSGRVRVTNNAAGVLFAYGSINVVEGTYYAFGQRLVIDRGTLIFDGRADNPGLDVVALRKNLAVEAGVEVQGTVRVPRVRLVSNPPVPDGEKLSWLITGQGLARASSADLAALSAASASLLTGGQRPLTSQIASRLGLDDITFRDSGNSVAGGTSTQVVALGKRVSDRLTIVYEQGLTVATNALRIEYTLSQTLTVRAEAGTISSIGIYFRRVYN